MQDTGGRVANTNPAPCIHHPSLVSRRLQKHETFIS